jgi:hypothetical protein
MITESDRLSEGLTRAAELWPEASGDKGLLMRHIVDAGVDTVLTESASRANRRTETIRHLAGSLNGVWPTTWRAELRDEWPQ